MNRFIAGWYLIYTKPRCEKKVANGLLEEKVDHYLPTMFTVNNGKRRRMIERPLFPSYIFVYLQKQQDYFASLNVEGALSYVRVGRQIARVTDDIVDQLRKVNDNGRNVEVSSDPFKPGQMVLINNGALSGQLCEVVYYKGTKKILVRVNLLNRCVLVDISLNYVVKV